MKLGYLELKYKKTTEAGKAIISVYEMYGRKSLVFFHFA